MKANASPIILMVAGMIVIAGATAAFFLIQDPAETDTPSADGALQEAQSTDADWMQGTLRDLSALGIPEGELLQDTDNDGLPNAIENFIYGSDPDAWSTNGEGIPDGWLASYGYDPALPGHAFRVAAVPDPSTLPDAYGGDWPYQWTLQDVYEWGRPAGWSEPSDGPWENGVDPRIAIDPQNGLPQSWLHHHGFGPSEAGVGFAESRLTTDTFTVQDNYEHDTDPRSVDTDKDTLPDSAEVGQYFTDPTLFSTSNSGIPDGWLVSHSLKATDPSIGSMLIPWKGMTVKEIWQFNLDEFGPEQALAGAGLVPEKVSTAGHGIPDGWLVRHNLDPLDSDLPEQVVQNASDFNHARNLTTTPANQATLPDRVLTVGDHYNHERPSDWNELRDGIWWNTLDPSNPDTDGDGIPDAVEMRGWYIQVTMAVGPDAETQWRHVSSDPLLNDTDGDGLTDGEEYFGRAVADEHVVVFSPTDPSNRDTAFSGLSDHQKVIEVGEFGLWVGIDDPSDDTPVPNVPEGESVPDAFVQPMLDPTRRDTSRSYLADGDELAHWETYVQSVGGSYTLEYKNSDCNSWDDVILLLPVPTAGAASSGIADRFSLLGDIDIDGVPNIIDNDADGDGLLNGWEIRPGLYRFSEFASSSPRPPTDPANPDTDCEGLPDGWETKHALRKDGAWTLDPSRSNTDGVGEPDNKENLDGDEVQWYSYSSSGKRTIHTFKFTNELEFARGTNPNSRDQDSDGVSEGWAHFWGRHYKDVLLPDGAGDIAPTQEQIDALEAAIGKDPLLGIGQVIKESGPHDGTIPYRRIVEVPEGTDDSIDKFERYNEDWSESATKDNKNPAKTMVQRGGFQEEVRLGVLEGEYIHTFADDYDLGLNPYLWDTDGDSLPDAWESYYGDRSGADCEDQGKDRLDASTPDADGTPAGDGLTNLRVYSEGLGFGNWWMHPCEKDTDIDGVPDDVEIDVSGMDPTNPFDAGAFSSGGDQDRDEVFDRDELVLGTNPALNDTDADGGLDGNDVILNPGQSEALIATWRSIGIAHTQKTVDTFTFYGEERGTDPTEPRSTLRYDVPDGWMLQFIPNLDDSSLDPEAVEAAYGCHRPDWWQEDRHGVWWWGASVGPTHPCVDDMDGDGLLDVNGEDPIPAASPNITRRDHPLQAMEDPSLDRFEIHKIAQTWGDCAGNPVPCRTKWSGQPDPEHLQAPTNLTLDDPLPTDIRKGVPFNVTGNVCLYNATEGTCHGVANRTVTVQLDNTNALNRSLGVAFTDSTGDFKVDACVCMDRNTTIPYPGMVAHSRDNGPVAWSLPTGDLTVGTGHSIQVRVYATSAILNESNGAQHPHFINTTLQDGGPNYHATGRNITAPSPVVLKSNTTVSLTVPDTVPWTPHGRSIDATVLVLDATGDPVPEGHVVNVTITKDGMSRPPIFGATGAGGIASLSIPTTGDGEVQIKAGSPATPYLSANDTGPVPVMLQAPLTLELSTDPPTGSPLRAGTDVSVQVHATSRGQSVPGVDISLSLGTLEVSTVTGTDGIARKTLETDDLQPGETTLIAETKETDTYAKGTDSATFNVVSGSILDVTVPSSASRAETIPITGQLRLSDGSGLAEQELTVRVDGHLVEQITTGSNGEFSADILLPDHLTSGLKTIVIQYDGQPSSAIDGTLSKSDLRIVVPTTIQVADQEAGRSGPLSFVGRLSNADGQTLRGERITIRIDGDTVGHFITDRHGEFTVGWTVPDDMEYGFHDLQAVYHGSSNGTYGASQEDVILHIPTTTTITMEPIGIIGRGQHTVVGNLTTNEGETLSGAVIDIELEDMHIGQTTTDDEGRYSYTLLVPNNVAPGDLTFEATYLGDSTFGASKTEEKALLQVQPQVRFHVPDEVGRGTSSVFRITLIDDLGRPLPGKELAIQAFGNSTRVDTGSDGTASVTVEIPPDHRLGAQKVNVTSKSDTGFLPVNAMQTVLVKEGASIQVIETPGSIDPTRPFHFSFQLKDRQGNPMADQLVTIHFEGDPYSTVVRTEANGIANATLPVPKDTTGRLMLHYNGDAVHGQFETMTEPLSIKPSKLDNTQSAVVQSETINPWIPVAIAVLGILALAGGIAGWIRIRSQQPVLQALRDARQAIATGDSWTDAVQSAYRSLVAEATMHGHEEFDADSVRDFMQSLASRAPIPPDAAVELTDLFEKATYSTMRGGKKEADTARKSLTRIIIAIEEFLQPTKRTWGGRH